MKVRLPYHEGHVEFDTGTSCRMLDSPVRRIREPELILTDAFSRPLNGPSFSEFAEESSRLLFIVNDGTRPTPTALILEHLYPHLRNHPHVRFIVATGTHRAPTETELERIFGRHLDEFRGNILVHDSRNPEGLTPMGSTRLGTPVSFNSAVLEADGIVAVNSVEPHYFAGFTGGRKSFLPGVAGFETIERNHSHALDPGAGPTFLDGNPVSEDMFEAVGMLSDRRIFSIQTVMNSKHEFFGASVGNLNASFLAAVDMAMELYSVETERQTSIVITVAPPPMDCSLYQAQKAMEHGRLALEPGGILILLASCWDGVGGTAFYDLLRNFRNDDKIADFMGENYRLGNHKAARMLSLSQYADLWAVTELEASVLEPARIVKKPDIQQAVDQAIRAVAEAGMEPSITVIPGGSLTVPRVI